MIKRKKDAVLIVIVFTLELIILINPNVLINSTKDALNLFINKLFISLFPFFVLNKILINYNLQGYLSKLNINSFLTIIMLSMISGMPSNAEYIKDALDNKIINIEDAQKLLLISFFPSPVFVITVVGYIHFKSIKIGIILLLIIYISNLILGLMFKTKNNNYTLNRNNNLKFMTILKKSIHSSMESLLIILGNIIMFSILLGILNNYLNLSNIQNGILASFLELSNAIKKVSYITNFNIKFSLTLFALSFSGLSVFSQASSILSEYNINFKKIILYKLLMSIIFSFSSFVLLVLLNHL